MMRANRSTSSGLAGRGHAEFSDEQAYQLFVCARKNRIDRAAIAKMIPSRTTNIIIAMELAALSFGRPADPAPAKD